MLSVSMDGKDGHGLKLEKVEPTFSSFNAMSTKITKKYYGQCFQMKYDRSLCHNCYRSLLCMGRVEALSNDFSTELT